MKKRIIAVISGKGGVGKTFITINLGLAMLRFGRKVTLVDADVSASNLGLQLGLYSFPKTLQDVLVGKARIENATYEHLGMKLIPSSISISSIDANIRRLKKVLNSLDNIVLIDSPPGLSSDALSVIDSCNEVLVISVPEVQSMANAVKVVHMARQKKKDVLGIVVNRHKDRYELSDSEIETMAESSILAKLPEEQSVSRSLFEKTPLLDYDPCSRASVEIKKLAAGLLEIEYEPPRFLFFNRLLGRLIK